MSCVYMLPLTRLPDPCRFVTRGSSLSLSTGCTLLVVEATEKDGRTSCKSSLGGYTFPQHFPPCGLTSKCTRTAYGVYPRTQQSPDELVTSSYTPNLTHPHQHQPNTTQTILNTPQSLIALPIARATSDDTPTLVFITAKTRLQPQRFLPPTNPVYPLISLTAPGRRGRLSAPKEGRDNSS